MVAKICISVALASFYYFFFVVTNNRNLEYSEKKHRKVYYVTYR